MSVQTLLSPTPSGERLSKLLQAEEMDPLFLAAANLYLQEKSVAEIGVELGLREDRVSQILSKEDVQKYIQNCILTQGFLNPLKSLKIIEGVIESLIQKGLESGNMTDKDLLDWIKELRATRESIAPKKSGPAVAVQVNNNIQKLYEDLS
jgi:hypothetical protein